jgi:hypothetical protein
LLSEAKRQEIERFKDEKSEKITEHHDWKNIVAPKTENITIMAVGVALVLAESHNNQSFTINK